MLPVAVIGRPAFCWQCNYILPVSWMTSCFHIMWHVQPYVDTKAIGSRCLLASTTEQSESMFLQHATPISMYVSELCCFPLHILKKIFSDADHWLPTIRQKSGRNSKCCMGSSSEDDGYVKHDLSNRFCCVFQGHGLFDQPAFWPLSWRNSCINSKNSLPSPVSYTLSNACFWVFGFDITVFFYVSVTLFTVSWK